MKLVLGKDDSNGEFYLKGYGKNNDEYMALLDATVFPVAPFATIGGLMLEHRVFETHPDRKIENVVPGEGADQNIVTITVQTANDRGTVTDRIQLWRDRCWAVKRIDGDAITKQGESVVRSRNVQICEYDGEVGDIPLLKQVSQETLSSLNDEELKPRWRKVVIVNSITPGAADLADFNVRGLVPRFDRVGETAPRRSVTWLLVVNGVVFVVVGVMINRKWRSTDSKQVS